MVKYHRNVKFEEMNAERSKKRKTITKTKKTKRWIFVTVRNI